MSGRMAVRQRFGSGGPVLATPALAGSAAESLAQPEQLSEQLSEQRHSGCAHGATGFRDARACPGSDSKTRRKETGGERSLDEPADQQAGNSRRSWVRVYQRAGWGNVHAADAAGKDGATGEFRETGYELR